MALLTEVQHKAASNSTTTVNVTVTAATIGNLMVVVIGWVKSAGQTITQVTDNASPANVYTQVPSAAGSNATSGYNTDIYYCASLSASPTQITAIQTSPANFLAVWAFEVSGFPATPLLPVSIDVAAGTTNQAGDVNGDETGSTVSITGSPAFVVAGIIASSILQNPKTGNEFISGGDITSGNASCSLITSTRGSHQPRWHDSTQLINFASSTAAFSLVETPRTSQRLGIFSKDAVLSCGAFDMGVPNALYGWYDDDFVAQFSGTTVGATVSGIASVPPGVFSKDATLDGAFDD